MSGIWTKTAQGWRPAPPRELGNEAELHDLVEGNIQMLPLAGSPRLFVLGREVQLGPGYADLLAVEASGRPVIVEVKLAKNPEAKRGIVAQVLSYAAFLQGSNVEALEQGPWRKALDDQDHASVLEAVKTQDQEDAVDSDTFVESLQEHLTNGRFRLVLVLDEMSAELERIVAYLDAVTLQALTVDLITISVYEVNGTEVAMPQRISPDPSAMPSFTMVPAARRAPKGVLSDGPDAFVDSIADIEGGDRALLNRLVDWAMEVVALPGVSLCTYTGVDRRRFTLLPRITTEKVGLITIWNDNRKPYLSMWRSVFERRAPRSIEAVEQALGARIGQGNTVANAPPELLSALTAAYREATGN